MTTSISRITLQGVASYSADTPQTIEGLLRINCFYGLNGSGKSTIAKYLQTPTELDFVSCAVTPDIEEGVIVYNQKFVKDNFWDSTQQPGVFTVNEENVEAEKAIEVAEAKIEQLKKQQRDIQAQADKVKDQKTKEQTDLENKVWTEKDKFVKTSLEFCLERKQRKNLFLDAVKAANLASDDITLEQLFEQAKELEKPDLKQKPLLTLISFERDSIELDHVNSEAIVGSSSSYLSTLVEKIGHSDWVRDGLAHFKQSDGVCPFCQETPIEIFEANLKALFDETYKQKCEQIASNKKAYEEAIKYTVSALSSEEFNDEYVTQSAVFAAAKSKLLACLNNNLNLLKDKEAKPSIEVNLTSSMELLAKLNKCIESINEQIVDFNRRITSKPQIKATIRNQFWQIHKRTYNAVIELVEEKLLIGTAMDPFHWRRNGPTPFVP